MSGLITESGEPPHSGDTSRFDPGPRVYVEAWPAGGWAVRLEHHPVPVSRHDTEEEAESRAAAYRRGLERTGPLAVTPAWPRR